MCWGHRDIRDSWVIERQLRADRTAERRDDLRVSDADRQSTIDSLSRHTADGRLTLEEFEARVDEALQATTRHDLDVALRELPVDRLPARPRYSRRRARAVVLWVLIITASVVTIGWGSLWWLVPLAWLRFGSFGHHHRTGSYRWTEPRREDELTRV